MATSGTVQTTVVEVQQLVDTAYRRCKLSSGLITDEMQDIGKFQLYTLLSGLPNQGELLWTIQRPLFGIKPTQQQYTFPTGALDIDKLLWRIPTRQSGGTAASSAGGTAANAFDSDVDTICTQTAPNGNISYQFASTSTVVMVGVNSYGTNTWTLVFESSTDGVTWTTVLSTVSASYVDDVFTWYDVFQSKPGLYFRVRETADGTLNVREVAFCTNFTETQIARLNQDDYSVLPNKSQPGQPNQFWVERPYDRVNFYVWPVPGVNEQFKCFSAWSKRYIQDVGALYNTIEVPSRWIDAITWDLTWRCSLELPVEVDKLDGDYKAFLENNAKQKMGEAFNEERDDSPIFFQPLIGVYTR